MFLNEDIYDDGEACEFVGDAGAVWFCEDDVDVRNTDLLLSLFNEIFSIDTFDLNLDVDLLVEWNLLQHFDIVESNSIFSDSPSGTRSLPIGCSLKILQNRF